MQRCTWACTYTYVWACVRGHWCRYECRQASTHAHSHECIVVLRQCLSDRGSPASTHDRDLQAHLCSCLCWSAHAAPSLANWCMSAAVSEPPSHHKHPAWSPARSATKLCWHCTIYVRHAPVQQGNMHWTFLGCPSKMLRFALPGKIRMRPRVILQPSAAPLFSSWACLIRGPFLRLFIPLAPQG